MLGVVLLGSESRSGGNDRERNIDGAVDKAVAYLLSQQKADGSWENGPRLDKPESDGSFCAVEICDGTAGAETAIVTYAFGFCNSRAKSAKRSDQKAVAWLEHVDLHGTYAIGLRAQVWNLLPESARTKPFIFARDRTIGITSIFGRFLKGANAGFYAYIYGADTGGVLATGMPALEQTGLPDNTPFDRSNSQYAVLGAWAVEQAGAEIPVKYWEDEDQAWKAAQQPDGSWTYNNVTDPTMVYEVGPGGKVTLRPRKPTDKIANSIPTMTCAGVATLYITQDYIMPGRWAHLFDSCNGGYVNVNIERGLAWIDKHIDQIMSLNTGNFHYAIYGVERIGVASGRKYIGGIDWFQRGAEALVQDPGSGRLVEQHTSRHLLFSHFPHARAGAGHDEQAHLQQRADPPERTLG